MKFFEKVAAAWNGSVQIPGVNAPYSSEDHALAALRSGRSPEQAFLRRANFVAAEEASRRWRAAQTEKFLAHQALGGSTANQPVDAGTIEKNDR